MKYSIKIQLNEWEAARLLCLIADGKNILNKQQRVQRGMDGYTYSELSHWEETLAKITSERCKVSPLKKVE